MKIKVGGKSVSFEGMTSDQAAKRVASDLEDAKRLAKILKAIKKPDPMMPVIAEMALIRKSTEKQIDIIEPLKSLGRDINNALDVLKETIIESMPEQKEVDLTPVINAINAIKVPEQAPRREPIALNHIRDGGGSKGRIIRTEIEYG